jgi:hypothetical protein
MCTSGSSDVMRMYSTLSSGLPGATAAGLGAGAVARLRELDLAKRPGVAETIDWANALAFLGADRLDRTAAADTLGAVVKDHEDQQLVSARLADIVGDG